MTKFAALVRENKERLHWLDAVLTGKDSTFGEFEIGFVADAFDCRTIDLSFSSVDTWLTMRSIPRLRGHGRYVWQRGNRAS